VGNGGGVSGGDFPPFQFWRINIERAAALAKLKSILSGGERRNLVINSDDLFVTPVIYKCDIR
jgi:hypothetical protein